MGTGAAGRRGAATVEPLTDRERLELESIDAREREQNEIEGSREVDDGWILKKAGVKTKMKRQT